LSKMNLLKRYALLFPPEVWVVSIATFVNRSVGFLGLFAAVFFNSLSFTPRTVAIALLLVGLGGVLGAIGGGQAASRVRPVTVLIVGTAMNIPLLLALATLQDDPVVTLILAAVSVAASQSFLAPAATLVTESSFHGDTATAFAFYRIFINIGSIVAPLIVSTLGSLEFGLMFHLSAAGSLVATGILVYWRRVLQPRAHASEVPSATSATSARKSSPAAVRNPALATWVVIVVFGIVMAIYAQHQSGIPLSVERLEDGVRLYAILLLINPAIIVGLELPLNHLLSRMQWNVCYAIGLAANGIGLAITGLGGSWAVCIVGFVVFSLGEALFAPQASAAIARLSGPGANSKNQGYLSAAQTIGIALGPALGAYAALNIRVPFWISVAAVSAGLAVAILVSTKSSTNTAPMGAEERGRSRDRKGVL
jgi:predicted MFS family arabinose efflux permease